MLQKEENCWDFLLENANGEGLFDPITELIRRVAFDVIVIMLIFLFLTILIKKLKK